MSSANNQDTHGYNLYNLEANFRTYLHAVINLKSISVKNYASDLRYFLGWYQLHTRASNLLASLEALNSDSIQSYRAYLQESNLPTASINRRLSTVRMFCKFLIDQNILTSNPAQHIVNVGSKHTLPNKKSAYIDPEFINYLASKGFSQSEVLKIRSHVTEFINIIHST